MGLNLRGCVLQTFLFQYEALGISYRRLNVSERG